MGRRCTRDACSLDGELIPEIRDGREKLCRLVDSTNHADAIDYAIRNFRPLRVTNNKQTNKQTNKQSNKQSNSGKVGRKIGKLFDRLRSRGEQLADFITRTGRLL
ncbi:hypothetical protein WN51_14254 [Melipona quadrifasciata]|uniref:Uncharacterized protein n=1 Tax=Melipona quadrifasciata TaxID=166423 RepID=A0A0M9A198_9HYME|nr:hypothetical protein WN51_14254 [Melipona quadrifasciata]